MCLKGLATAAFESFEPFRGVNGRVGVVPPQRVNRLSDICVSTVALFYRYVVSSNALLVLCVHMYS